MAVEVLTGDCRALLDAMPAASVQCCVTSPPYFGLRDYGVAGQIGLEPTPDEYVAEMVAVFRKVRRVLRDDGTLWLNLGDSYSVRHIGRRDHGTGNPTSRLGPRMDGLPGGTEIKADGNRLISGYKPKDLLMIPARVALALQADGWWLRSDIVWCLSGGAWLYARTQKGDMPAMLKDLARLDPRTVQLWNGSRWTQVLRWGPSSDTSEHLELVLRSGERIGCTGNHLWPTQRGNIPARDLKTGDVIEMCRLPEPDGARKPRYLTDRLLWLIGLYLAEGSRSDDTIQLGLNADEIAWMPKIIAAAADVNATVTHTLSGNCLAVRLHGRVLVAALNEYIGGKTSIDVHLRCPVWRLPNAAIQLIVEGYLAGDGHIERDRIRLGFCRNYALERDLRTAAARLGATLTLKPTNTNYQNGSRPTFTGEWRWTRNGHHNEKDRGEIMEIRKSRARQFWDVSVADEPHLFALSSGILTHNCKPNPMPESVTDRPTCAHEHVFLLTKSAKYFYDADAIREPLAASSISRLAQNLMNQAGSRRANGGAKTNGPMKAVVRTDKQRGHSRRHAGFNDRWDAMEKSGQRANGANARDVWTIAAAPYSEAHFATFPPALAERCINAGTHPGDTVLDPFGGAGKTGLVADRLQRDAILIELNPQYVSLARNRIAADRGPLSDLFDDAKQNDGP